MKSGVFVNIDGQVVNEFKKRGIEALEIDDKKDIPSNPELLVLNYNEDVFSICHNIKKSSQGTYILVLAEEHDAVEPVTREEKQWFKADEVLNLPINEFQINNILGVVHHG